MSTATPMKPLLSSLPGAQSRHYRTELDEAYRRVMDSEWFILGEEVKAFEREFAAFCEVDAAVGVANGTEAIQLALMALELAPGSEVITTAHTAVATVAAIEMAGLNPVFADIDPSTYTLDPKSIEKVVSKETKAIVAVHLYGHPVDMDGIEAICRQNDLRLVEDCAQAHGARWNGKRVGSFGEVATYSFYPTKNLGAIGDGGAVATQDSEIAQRVRVLREYGWKERYVSHVQGMNSRLDELQAAFLRVKLAYLDEDNAKRRHIAERYSAALGDLPIKLPTTLADAEPVFHLYVINTDARDDLQAHLKSLGVMCGIHYPVPIHHQPAYKSRVRGSGDLVETECAAARVLSLPMYPELSDEDVARVIDGVRSFYTA